MNLAKLADRAVLMVSGEDRVSFLQGLVSNDVAAAGPGRAVWAALLTPQGKWLADFFIVAEAEHLLLDCEAGLAEMLQQKLTRFRLRAKVTIERTDRLVYAAWGAAPAEGLVVADPRAPDAGWRVLTDGALDATATAEAWDRHRLALGLPDGSRDLESEKSTLLEAGFDELHGVSWTKGCYMGQELTARTKYRGLLKRRLMPVRVKGTLPAPGTPVWQDGAEVGVMRSGQDGLGLALLRLEAAGGHDLVCGEATLTPSAPAWMLTPA